MECDKGMRRKTDLFWLNMSMYYVSANAPETGPVLRVRDSRGKSVWVVSTIVGHPCATLSSLGRLVVTVFLESS